MLAPTLLITLVLGFDDTTEKPHPDGILTPAEVVTDAQRHFWNDPLTVRFRVAGVSTVKITRLDGTSYTGYRLHTDSVVGPVEINGMTGGGFYVALSAEFVNALKRIGVPDISNHFMDKRVEFRGRLAAYSIQFAGTQPSLRFYMPINTLDELRAVKDGMATNATSKVYSLPAWPDYGYPR